MVDAYEVIRRQGRRTSGSLVRWLLVASVVVVGCRSTPVARQASPTDAPEAEIELPGAPAPWWNTYVEDVTTTLRTDDATSRRLNLPPQVVWAHNERTIDSVGNWHSVTITSVDRSGMPGSGFQSSPMDTVRIEDDGDGSPPQYSDIHGRCLSLPSSLPMDGLPRPGVPAAVAVLETMMSQAVVATGRLIERIAPQVALHGRSWVYRTILTDSTREARRRAILRTPGDTSHRDDGRLVFRTAESGRTMERVIDTVLWAPVEMNVRRKDQLESRMTIEHTRLPDGSVVRSRMRVEELGTRLGSRARTTEVVYTNVHLEKRRVEDIKKIGCRGFK